MNEWMNEWIVLIILSPMILSFQTSVNWCCQLEEKKTESHRKHHSSQHLVLVCVLHNFADLVIISVKYVLTKRTWVRRENAGEWKRHVLTAAAAAIFQFATASCRALSSISSCILHSSGYCSCTRQMKASASDQVTRDIIWLSPTISRSNRVNLLHFHEWRPFSCLVFSLTYLLSVILSCWRGMTEC